MARFLLDEQINPAAAIQLRRKGYDATSLYKAGGAGSADAEVLERATAEHRAVVTFNVVDFEALAAQWFAGGKGHGGIVLVHAKTIPQESVGKLVRALARLADRFPGTRSLEDQVIYLTRET